MCVLNLATRHDRRISKLVRSAINCEGTPWTIDFIDGFDEPKLVGKGFHWTTRTGIPVQHPSAYSKEGWSSLVYHASTYRITVGKGWVLENILKQETSQ